MFAGVELYIFRCRIVLLGLHLSRFTMACCMCTIAYIQLHVASGQVLPVLLTGQEVELLRDHLSVETDNHTLGQGESGGGGGSNWNIAYTQYRCG